MRWNCPHCSETVSIGIDIEQVKRAYVRCGACKGVALLQTKTAYADHEAAKLAEIQMSERQLEIQAAQLQAAQAEQARRIQQAEIERARAIEAAEKAARATAIAEAQIASHRDSELIVQSNAQEAASPDAILVTPPPFNPTPAAMRAIQSNALDIAREIDLEIENTIRTLAALDRNGGNRRILREATLSAGDIAVEAEEEVAPEVIEDTIITVTELESANETSAFEEPAVPTPHSAAAYTDQAAALANFDRSNPAMQIPNSASVANSPQPPAFLMRKETLIPMPIQFATNDANAAPAPEEPNQKILKFAVLVATIIAIVSGLYLFTQGQKLMQSAAIIEAPRR